MFDLLLRYFGNKNFYIVNNSYPYMSGFNKREERIKELLEEREKFHTMLAKAKSNSDAHYPSEMIAKISRELQAMGYLEEES